MKKTLFLGAIALFTIFSCGEDRDDTAQEATISQKIVGKWTIAEKVTNGVTIPKPQACPNHGNFIFNSDKKLSENYNSTVNNNCITDEDLYNYSIDENSKKITATNSYGDKMVYSISAISDDQLVLVNTEGSDTIKYTFTK